MNMISLVQCSDPWRQSRNGVPSIKLGRICWKGKFSAWSKTAK